MKYYLSRVFITEHGSGLQATSDALVVAANQPQAEQLHQRQASHWAGEGRPEHPGAWHYKTDDSSFVVYQGPLTEISPSTFDELRELYPVTREELAALTEQYLPEQARTLARRIGDQLARHGVKVSHSRLLHAVAASLGKTDWQVLKASSAQTD